MRIDGLVMPTTCVGECYYPRFRLISLDFETGTITLSCRECGTIHLIDFPEPAGFVLLTADLNGPAYVFDNGLKHCSWPDDFGE